MEAVTTVQPKKVFVLHSAYVTDTHLGGLVEAITESQYKTVSDPADADAFVVMWNADNAESDKFLQHSFEMFGQAQKNIVFVCVQKVEGATDDLKKKRIGEINQWQSVSNIPTVILELPFNYGQGKNKFQEALSIVAENIDRAVATLERRRELEKRKEEAIARKQKQAEEETAVLERAKDIMSEQKKDKRALSQEESNILKEAAAILGRGQKANPAGAAAVLARAVAAVPASAAVQRASFFEYAHAHDASMKHSRQVRHKYAEDNLCFYASDKPDVRMKKVVLLFAHYMSIEDLKSTLSETMEAILAKELDYPDYQNTHTTDRATFFGKNKDRVAIELRRLLLGRYGDINNDFLNALITLLRPVDSLETSFSYESKKGDINALINAAETFYDKQSQKRAARREESDAGMTSDADSVRFVGFGFYRSLGDSADICDCKRRLEILDETLTPREHDAKNYTPYQLMMVFAHYMSAAVKSPLSKFLEDKLILALFNEVGNYNCQIKRGAFFATAQGIKKDIALLLRNKINEKIVGANEDSLLNAWKHLELFIGLLECVTRVESKIKNKDYYASYKYESPETLEKRVQDTIRLVDRVYKQLSEKSVLENVDRLMGGLDLPEDAENLICRFAGTPRLLR